LPSFVIIKRGNNQVLSAVRESNVRLPWWCIDHRRGAIQIPDKISYIVVIIDELADLMQTLAADVESAIARITQMARAADIHLIVATQTPRADVITANTLAKLHSKSPQKSTVR
jgi:FtsK/SpoIIIE family